MKSVIYSDEQKLELITKAKELKAAGRDFRSISRELGVSYSRLYAWVYPDKKRSKNKARPKKRILSKPSLVTIPMGPVSQGSVLGDLNEKQKGFLKNLIKDHRQTLDDLERIFA